jgi:hypothetical protein
LIIPLRNLGQPIVRNQERTGLILAEVLQADGGNKLYVKKLAGLKTTVACYQPRIGIDKKGYVKPKSFDTLGYLLDLPFRVTPRVLYVYLKLFDIAIGNRKVAQR